MPKLFEATSKQNFRQETSALLRLGTPLVIAHLCVIGMGVTDTLMAGRVSANDLAGLAVGSGLWITISVLIIGLMSALAPIVGQHLGAGQDTKVAGEFQQSLSLALLISIPTGILLWFAPALLSLREMETQVAVIAGNYLQILAFATPAVAVAASLRNVIEASGQTRISMAVNVAAFVLNIGFDAWFVFGGLGLDPLGGTGCALATGLLSWMIVIALAWHLLKSRRYKHYQLFQEKQFWHWPRLRHQLYVGVPIAIGASGEVLFFGIMAFMLAPLGAIAVGANQIAQNFGALMYMVPLGMSQAIAIRVAHSIGAQKQDRARYSAWCGVVLGIGFAMFSASLTFFARDWIAFGYTNNQAIIDLAVQLLVFCALYQVFDSVQILAWGGLRGYKDTRAAMVIQLTAYWLIGFPLGYQLCFNGAGDIDALGVQGFWWGIVIALGFACFAMLARLQWISRQPKVNSLSPN